MLQRLIAFHYHKRYRIFYNPQECINFEAEIDANNALSSVFIDDIAKRKINFRISSEILNLTWTALLAKAKILITVLVLQG